jgi:hypothetical protein
VTITTRHPASRHGIPVILDDTGAVLEPLAGLRACMQALDWDKHVLAVKCGVSVRTAEGWLAGKPFPASVYNVLRDALEDRVARRG